MNINFIGYGNMAKAIAKGLIKKEVYSLSVSAPSLSKGINADKIKTYHDNKEHIKEAQVIILAVKPKLMDAVLKEIAPHIPPDCLLISVAAGLNLNWFKKNLPNKQAVVRTIPNIPAEVGLAATPMIANEFTTASQKKCAELIFSSIGLTTWAEKEEDMDAFTALSASGPAYVFLFIEALVNAAVALGLNETIAKSFAMQTIKGALKLVDESDLNLSQLRNNVVTPGGTTAAALSILHGPLDTLILNAMSAAKARSEELGLAE